jgi:hypothetical protein
MTSVVKSLPLRPFRKSPREWLAECSHKHLVCGDVPPEQWIEAIQEDAREATLRELTGMSGRVLRWYGYLVRKFQPGGAESSKRKCHRR